LDANIHKKNDFHIRKYNLSDTLSIYWKKELILLKYKTILFYYWWNCLEITIFVLFKRTIDYEEYS
jgi:hypothetical protein